ncbi:hypothetical protein [Brachyspira alvinipulli]|uniref:hypothetical protein n=1 Tax=Brachyspira alvinipulli TaxID=84379 RepID=UPI000487766B|nr:hypothetical protein [Brachyspira alvinipulli]
MMLLCDHNCIFIDYYAENIQSIDESAIKILPKGYELLYILKNFDISKEIENDIPLSIIIEIYKNKILQNYKN